MRIYRVVIDSYPLGCDQPTWTPKNWEPQVYHDVFEGDIVQEFNWPRRKNFFTRKAAQYQLSIFEKYGATGHVQMSKPIDWEES